MEVLFNYLLKTVKKVDLKPLLLEWGRLDLKNIDFNSPKSDYSEQLVAECQRCSISFNNVAELDLLFHIKYPERKNWEAHQLQNEATETCQARESCHQFRKSFSKCLNKMFYCDLVIKDYGASFWCRISKPEKTTAVFAIYYPKSEYLVVAKSASKLKASVCAALAESLGYNDSKLLPLHGKYPDSLAQMLLHTSQDDGEEYTHDEGYYLPKKRKAASILKSTGNKRIKLENACVKRRFHNINEQTFGPYVQPTLQQLNIQMKARFRTKTTLPELSKGTVCRGRISFLGTDVLEGLRSLVPEKYAVAPLPTLLTKIASVGKNDFVVSDK